MKTLQRGRRFILKDGRRISWTEYGSADGEVLFYCHGFPACRLEARLFHEAARDQGWRLVVLDRPGMGASDFQAGRTLLAWPEDLARVADTLGLACFSLLGVSGGAPYALAAAHTLKGRLNGVALAGGLAPLHQDLLKSMNWPARFSFRIAGRHPRLAWLLFGRMLGPLLRRRPSVGLDLLSFGAPSSDRQTLADATVRSILTESIRSAFDRGSRGAVQELGIYARPWGFDPREIDLPVTLWHGLSDATVPAAHGRWLAARLPGCRPTFLPGEGHFSLPVRHMTRILESLRP